MEEYGDDYQVILGDLQNHLACICSVFFFSLGTVFSPSVQSMFMDTKLNKMQHSVATLEKLCKRYQMYKDKNPLLVGT